MGGTGIRYTGYDIRLYMITLRKLGATLITHFFNTDSFVRGRRISIIYPQEGTDFHVFSRLYQRPHTFRCHHCNLSRSQFAYRLVPQVQISKTFKGDTICSFLFAHGHRSTSHLISGRIDSLRCHDQKCHGAFNDLLGILNALYQVILLIHNGCHQLRGVDVSAAHLQEMGMSFCEQILYNSIGIIDLTNRGDGISSVMGTHHQRLGFKIRDTSDTKIAPHFIDILVKFGTKRCILDVVNGPVITFLFAVNCHSGASGSQMGMIVCSEKQIKYTVFFCCDSKKSTHF